MKILRVDPQHLDSKILREAAAVLKSGGLVVYPTETAYALGCDAASSKARQRIFEVKGRGGDKKLPLIVSSLTMARRLAYRQAGVAELPPAALRLARRHWPGPLTLAVSPTVALRVSPHPVARGLAQALGRAVVSTSANRSGEPAKYDVLGVIEDLGLKPDLILDAGPLRPTRPSTIVGFESGQPVVLRPGPIKI